MSVLAMVLVAILSSAVTTAVIVTVANMKIRKRLHGSDPIDMLVSIGHQHMTDNAWREHNFQVWKKQLMLQAEEERKKREAAAGNC